MLCRLKIPGVAESGSVGNMACTKDPPKMFIFINDYSSLHPQIKKQKQTLILL